MNSKIKALNEKLELLESDQESVKVDLQAEWNEVFKDIASIRDIIVKLEASKDYHTDQYGEIASYVKWYDLSDFEDCKEYFENYMQETHFVQVDWVNDCLSYSQGPCIVINDDGDVYDQDSGKFIVFKKDYRNDDDELDEVLRNSLIEAYMDKSGYYPGVFSVDRYDNIFWIDTKAKA